MSHNTLEHALDMVKSVSDYCRAYCRETSLPDFNKPKGQSRRVQLYLFVHEAKEKMQRGSNCKMTGKDLIEMLAIDGKYIMKKLLEICKSNQALGWQEYDWSDLVTKLVEHSSSYKPKFGELQISCE